MYPFSETEIEEVVHNFKLLTEKELKQKYPHKQDSSGWNFQSAKESILKEYTITKINYRPFDDRFTAYTRNSGGFIGRPRDITMNHIINKNNISLIICRQQSTYDFQHAFVTNKITDLNSISLQTKEQSYIFPLFIYPDFKNQHTIESIKSRDSNLNQGIISQIEIKLNLKYSEVSSNKEFSSNDILDYIYAILYSKSYREKYKEFFKIDFPRVPYPKDNETFWKLVKLGEEIRQIHLLESPEVEKFITKYPIDGSNLVGKVKYQDGKVFINETQYFEKVPQIAWEFYIGGYQPAQKWLKDRKDRTLNFEDILHYQKIIVALNETDRLMKEIDKINFI